MGQQNTIGRTSTTVKSDGISDGFTEVQYHNTVVVKFNHWEIVLNSGGWRTNTTKTRMNQTANQVGLGYSVYQKDFDWYVNYEGKVFDFTDGIILSRR